MCVPQNFHEIRILLLCPSSPPMPIIPKTQLARFLRRGLGTHCCVRTLSSNKLPTMKSIFSTLFVGLPAKDTFKREPFPFMLVSIWNILKFITIFDTIDVFLHILCHIKNCEICENCKCWLALLPSEWRVIRFLYCHSRKCVCPCADSGFQ